MVLTGYVAATSTSASYATVTRHALSGAIDISFGSTGTGIVAISNHLFRSIALEADVSIIVGGKQRYLAGDGTTHDQLAVGHLSADGVLDISFGSNGTGFSYAQVGANSSGYSLAIDPLTGDILLGGFTGPKIGSIQGAAIVRFSHS